MNVGFDAGVYFVCTWASFEALLIYVDPLRLQLSQQARIMSVVLLPSFFFFFFLFFLSPFILFCFASNGRKLQIQKNSFSQISLMS
jgi:hypothetical protein